jgi:hypothetical protein
MRNRAFFLIPAALAVVLAGCVPVGQGADAVSPSDLAAFQKVFMSSYYAEREGTPAGSKGLTPFLKVVDAQGAQARATINTGLLSNTSFSSLTPKAFANYPEPGQTTTFTITTKDATNTVYDIVATTAYPAGDIRSTYVEEYYVKDGNPTFVTPADGKWDVNDPIVKQSGGSWVQDQKARVQQVLTFTDGTTRAETIVAQTQDWGLSPTFAPKFASFDVNGSLDFSQAFYPQQIQGTDSDYAKVRFSSVVVYDVTPSANSSFWFWQGTQAQSILGIRYYTEYWDTTLHTFNSYTVAFEKTIDTLTTTGGSFSQTLQTVFVGSQFNTLAESVLRQQVSYPLDPATDNLVLSMGQKATNMQTRVANITGQKDFYLQQLNTDTVSLSTWATTTIYTPTGAVNEVVATKPNAFLYSRTQAVPAGGIPLAVPSGTLDNTGTGDLATLYTSIQEGNAVVPTGTTIPGSIQPPAVLWQYSGSQGTTVQDTTAYRLGNTGTVEAWVYINQQTDTGGIVHKGVQADFSDEAYSLQFWGNQGQIAWVIDKPGSAGAQYDLLTSTINLNTGKWYYLVATWDATASPKYNNLYINGTLNNTMVPSWTPNEADPANTSAVIIGSQLPTQYSAAYGYFGFDGKINGVRITATPKTAAAAAADYATYVLQTANW